MDYGIDYVGYDLATEFLVRTPSLFNPRDQEKIVRGSLETYETLSEEHLSTLSQNICVTGVRSSPYRDDYTVDHLNYDEVDP
jgi:hypothetical protein